MDVPWVSFRKLFFAIHHVDLGARKLLGLSDRSVMPESSLDIRY